MKIVYAVHHLPPRYTGGAENRALRTARWMQSQGHDVAIICVEAIDQPAPAYADTLYEGVRTRRLSFDHRVFPDPERWKYDNALIEERVGEFLAEHHPDVFHLISGYLMTAGAIRAARAAGVPVVITLTDYWFLCPRITLLRSDGSLCPAPPADPLGCVRCLAEEKRRFRWLAKAAPGAVARLWQTLGPIVPAAQAQSDSIRERRRLLDEALASATLLISPSHFLQARFVENGVPPDKIHLMRQGLAIPARMPPRLNHQATLVIGYLGQLKPHKGVDLLVEAGRRLAARGHRFKIAIYGNEAVDRRYTHELKRQAQGADWIEWRGVYAAKQVWEVMAGLDAVVVPSRWYENSPNVILEAQAARVPVVASDLGGMAELIRHGVDGLLFKADDAPDLERQLARLMETPDLIASLRANAPAVKTLDQDMTELLDVYDQVLAQATEAKRSK